MQIVCNDLKEDLIKTIDVDIDKILEKLPQRLNKEFNITKWFNLFSGTLKETTRAESSGNSIIIYSNLIGKAFDISGIWNSPEVRDYVSFRAAEGYYKRYMQAKREGRFTQKIKGKKRIPFLIKPIYRSEQYILEILKGD